MNRFNSIDNTALDIDVELEATTPPPEESPYRLIEAKINELAKQALNQSAVGLEGPTNDARTDIKDLVFRLLPDLLPHGDDGLYYMPSLTAYLRGDPYPYLKLETFTSMQCRLYGYSAPFSTVALVSPSILFEELEYLFESYDPRKGGTFTTALFFQTASKQRKFLESKLKQLNEVPQTFSEEYDDEGRENVLRQKLQDTLESENILNTSQGELTREDEVRYLIELHSFLYAGFLLRFGASGMTDQDFASISAKKAESLGYWKSYYTFYVAGKVHTDNMILEDELEQAACQNPTAFHSEVGFVDQPELIRTAEIIHQVLRGSGTRQFNQMIHEGLIDAIFEQSCDSYLLRLVLGKILAVISANDLQPDQAYKLMMSLHGYGLEKHYKNYNPFKKLMGALLKQMAEQIVPSSADIESITVQLDTA